MTSQLSSSQQNTISRIAGLVLTNAMIFHEILSEHDDRVVPLQHVVKEHKGNLTAGFSEHWEFIIDEINYYPIFHVAAKILLNLTSNHFINKALGRLALTAQTIVEMRVALRHDLMGRIYHRLLVEAKYLGTYYTSIPAATLLLKLALRPGAWPTRWHDLDEVREFRIADLACGTGTLLMAAAEVVTDNYVGASAAHGETIDLSGLHNSLAEDILYGYDVLPSAIHLTASTLALRAPEIAFAKMNIFDLPLGGPYHRLGSIEFLKGKDVQIDLDLFGATPLTKRVTGKGVEDVKVARLPEMDLCVMNPPFTRSVGGNLLFGSMPEEERKEMQQNLKKLVRKPGVQASITAGLGSVFVAAADPYIKPGGCIALVLPKAVLSGVAWGRTRELLSCNYRLEYIIASHDPERWNFSESTSLSEVLLVARKLGGDVSQDAGNVVAVNLWHNPTTAFEALAIAQTLLRDGMPDIAGGQGALNISLGKEKQGEAIAIPWDKLKARDSWMLPCAFAQSDLVRAAYHLHEGDLWLPGHGEVGKVPLCPLGDLGSLGPDVRDVHDGFSVGEAASPYPAFWNHDAKAVYTLAQKPNKYLSPLPKPKKGRPLRKLEHLWPLAGNVLIAERLRLNTQSVFALRLPQEVLSNVWWPLRFKRGVTTKRHEKGLVLWLNSTLGLLLFVLHREETEGAWVKFKKPVLARLPVIDLKALSSSQLKELASAYDRVSNETLQPFPEMNNDPVRAEIDNVVAQVLKLPDFSVLRRLLAQEPVVCLKRL